MYSKLGGCLGVTAKLGPLASTDLCAGVKGLLERLITHFGLGSSKSGRTLWDVVPTGERPCFLGNIVLVKYPLRNSTVLLRHLADLPMGVPACLALSLAEHLTTWGGVELSAQRVSSSGEEGELAWEISLSASERVLSSSKAWEISLSASEEYYLLGKPGNCLPGRCHSLPVKECYLLGKPGNFLPGRSHSLPVKECYFLGKPGNCLPGRCHSLLVKECYLLGKAGNCLPWKISLSPNERVLSTGEAWELPAWESSLSASERVLSSGEAWGLPAWEKWLQGRALSPREDWEAWGEALRVNLPAWPLLSACLLFAQGKALATRETWELCQIVPPSFLFIRLLSFLTCLSLTLMNPLSLIFSMNSWHCW